MNDRERLIELICEGMADRCGAECKIPNKKYCNQCFDIADYLLEHGVIVPPCKVGDKIYIHQFDNNLKKIVVECEIIEHNKTEGLFKVKTVDGRILTLLFQFIGKTVFLTREEAEKALKGE